MANIKDFIKKIGNETVSLEEQQRALAAVEKTIVEAKAKREESIGKNVDLVISALKKIESDLEAKLIELNNTPAKQGVAGPQGEKGRDGRDGKDGYKGQDGKDGVDGKDGKDGSDGISVTDAKVDFDGSLVITLSDGREIDAGTVVSSDVAKNIHSVQTAGTGSTSQAVLDAIAAIQATIATYGTMATQNKTAVDIEGGTIDNTVIGATTPAAGTFTTITGQTEVLKGTGQNLVVYSQALATAGAWYNSGAAVTNNTTDVTDPLGGSTATKIVGTGSPAVYQYQNLNTLVYTYSIYLRTLSGSVSTRITTFLSASPYTTIGTSTVTVTSTWQRFNFTTTAPSSAAVYAFQLDGFGSNTIYAWGAQQEIGSTANTYIPTTTTAIYGTPTLSFSGVAGLGLESNGALYVSPAGTGALQAQATTSSTVGGNARGANAVDWQTSRDTAAKIAAGQFSVISGGYANTANAYQSNVAGGAFNLTQGNNNFIGGGAANTANGGYLQTNSVITGGYTNTANGFYNFIGAGFTNSGTSASAVTTQNGTMNGTTAVTLSGSNANIKVGQYITGTSIAGDTYVAAISGTALTLSKAASGSSTSTLSFYTPHGVVVGGGNNQATGSYSFIGGGGDAGTAANRNVASGAWSAVVGGFKTTASGLWSSAVGGGGNTASGEASFVGGGGSYGGGLASNTASATSAFVGAGYANTAAGYCSTTVGGSSNNTSNNFSFIGGGANNTANGASSAIMGGTYGTSRGIVGNSVFPACDVPITGSAGVSQAGLLILGRETANATPTVLCSNSSAASGTNQVILPNNSAYYFKGWAVSTVTGGGNTKGWEISGVIKRGAGVGTTALVGTPTVVSSFADAGAATWGLTATADTTNGGLAITFTGQAATTIRTVCKIETTEVTY